MLGEILLLKIWGCIFLNDLKCWWLYLQGNDGHSTYHFKVYQVCNNMGTKITWTEVRKSNGYICVVITHIDFRVMMFSFGFDVLSP